MQSSTGQYSTHAGDPAHPVQHSVMTASSLGFFLRGVVRPLDRGSCLSSSGTLPTAPVAGSTGIQSIISHVTPDLGPQTSDLRPLVLGSQIWFRDLRPNTPDLTPDT